MWWSDAEWAASWSDVQRAVRAIAHVFRPKKIDYFVMGHRMPHLHCHLFPQHAADDPKRNPNISDGPLHIAAPDMHDDVIALKAAWLQYGGD